MFFHFNFSMFPSLMVRFIALGPPMWKSASKVALLDFADMCTQMTSEQQSGAHSAQLLYTSLSVMRSKYNFVLVIQLCPVEVFDSMVQTPPALW